MLGVICQVCLEHFWHLRCLFVIWTDDMPVADCQILERRYRGLRWFFLSWFCASGVPICNLAYICSSLLTRTRCLRVFFDCGFGHLEQFVSPLKFYVRIWSSCPYSFLPVGFEHVEQLVSWLKQFVTVRTKSP